MKKLMMTLVLLQTAAFGATQKALSFDGEVCSFHKYANEEVELFEGIDFGFKLPWGSVSLDLYAQRNAFAQKWYFNATGNANDGWSFSFAQNAKEAAMTVTLKADGSTAIAGALPNGTDEKGKPVSLKVSASGYANVGEVRSGTGSAALAD